MFDDYKVVYCSKCEHSVFPWKHTHGVRVVKIPKEGRQYAKQ